MSQVHLCFPDDDAKLPDLYSTCKKNGRKCFLGNKKVPFCPLEYNLHAIMNKKGIKIMGDIVGEILPTSARYCFLRVVKSALPGNQ